MSRLIACALVVAASPAYAQDATTDVASTDVATSSVPPDITDQGLAASIGIAGGGRTTPGGLRITGHYLYQLSAEDWFVGMAQFTFGSGAGGCFRDRMDDFVCDHGLTDGASAVLGATVRRFFGGRDQFWPFARAGVGVGLVRFTGDDVTGLTIPLHVGGGLRVTVAERIAVIAEAMLDVGFGVFSNGLGLEPQLGAGVTAGAEFSL